MSDHDQPIAPAAPTPRHRGLGWAADLVAEARSTGRGREAEQGALIHGAAVAARVFFPDDEMSLSALTPQKCARYYEALRDRTTSTTDPWRWTPTGTSSLGHESVTTTLRSYAKAGAGSGARQKRVLDVLKGGRMDS